MENGERKVIYEKTEDEIKKEIKELEDRAFDLENEPKYYIQQY